MTNAEKIRDLKVLWAKAEDRGDPETASGLLHAIDDLRHEEAKAHADNDR